METNPSLIVGLPDLMHAARAEAGRVMAEHEGDFVAEHQIVLARLSAAEVITDEEAETLLQIYKLGYEAGEPKGDPPTSVLCHPRALQQDADEQKTQPRGIGGCLGSAGIF